MTPLDQKQPIHGETRIDKSVLTVFLRGKLSELVGVERSNRVTAWRARYSIGARRNKNAELLAPTVRLRCSRLFMVLARNMVKGKYKFTILVNKRDIMDPLDRCQCTWRNVSKFYKSQYEQYHA